MDTALSVAANVLTLVATPAAIWWAATMHTKVKALDVHKVRQVDVLQALVAKVAALEIALERR